MRTNRGRRRRSAILALALALGMGNIMNAEAAGRESKTPRLRTLKSWDDAIKAPDGSETRRHVEIVFDYTTGTAREVAHDTSGKLLSSRILTTNLPRPTTDEIGEAVQILRADPELGRIIERTRAVTEGGFILEEASGRPCEPGTRCLQILLLSPDRSGLIRRAVVDLTKLSIAYRLYIPDDGLGGAL